MRTHPQPSDGLRIEGRENILSDLTDEKLAAAVELNSAELLRVEGRLPWVEFHDDGQVVWVFGGDTWPRNSVGLARFTSETADQRIGEILARHLEEKVACNWIVGPLSKPADLAKHLRASGFHCMLHAPGMACDLTKLPLMLPAIEGIATDLVDEAPLLHPLTTERRRRRQAGRSAMTRVQPRQIWHFAATSNGKVVGEATLCTGAGVAGLYDVAVLEKFRGRGIGTALVHAAAVTARDRLGYRAAVLASTGKGFGVYQRLGFHEVCKLSFWKYGKIRQSKLANFFRRLRGSARSESSD